jgi:nicotinamidase-related amidase
VVGSTRELAPLTRDARKGRPRESEEAAVTAKKLLATLILPVLVLSSLPAAAEEEQEVELRPALLVIDVQNIWLPRMAEEDRTTVPDKINETIALFRERGHPIIRVYHSDPKRGPEPDTEPFEFPEWVAVTDDDPAIVKAHPSSFTKTDLEQLLTESDRNIVFLCGLSATGCVLATYFGALEREFMVIMVQDALLSGDSSHTQVIEEICYSMTIEEVKDTLEGRYQ